MYRLKREYSGRGIEQIITPACSCGWRGKGYAAWNDYQMTMVKVQEDMHIKEGHKTLTTNQQISAWTDPEEVAE
jgi:hypothetical protein